MASFKKTTWAGLLSGIAALMVALPSFASEPATQGSIQFGVGFRYGKELNDGDFNPWGTGLGLNGGITLPVLPIYVGGNIEYFFGEKVDLGAGASQKGNIWQITAEGGYDIGLGSRLVLRPKLGLGPATARGEGCFAGVCNSDSKTHMAIIPGATFMVFLPVLSLSFDGRYEVVTSDPSAKAFIFSAGIGF